MLHLFSFLFYYIFLMYTKIYNNYYNAYRGHIVQFGKFHRIGGAPPAGGAPPETFPNVKYDAPEEVGGDRKCFDSPIRK